MGGFRSGVLALRLCQQPFRKGFHKQIPAVVHYFNAEKAHDIYAEAGDCIGVIPMSDTTKLLVGQAVSQLKATSATLVAIKQEM